MLTVRQILTEHFRCPDVGLEFDLPSSPGSREGYFRFGEDTVCFARSSTFPAAPTVGGPLHDALDDVRFTSSRCALPFDPAEVVENLRRERYIRNSESNGKGQGLRQLIRTAYYGGRPFLPVAVRKHLQRAFLAGRMRTQFPKWPVDRTVDGFLERLLALSLRVRGLERIPFIWFWPGDHLSAAIMTHDVETSSGVKFCSTSMDMDEQFGIRSSFHLIPEGRYMIPDALLGEIRQRGFEINIHDLNHDGRLYWRRDEFLRRAARINQHARRLGANGFRSGVLYRNLDWYDALDFSYDMSVPNVGHLDPQAGGCCTVMPYFVGRILELPVTATQDYPLFQILREYSIEHWIRQINLILDGHGLISFIAHPDYVVEGRARATYRALLAYLARLRSEIGLWIALPGEVNEWWRARSQMRLVRINGTWQVEGQGKERARIAYACLDGDDVRFTFDAETSKQKAAVAQLTQSTLENNV
jgi:hypothetical protein